MELQIYRHDQWSPHKSAGLNVDSVGISHNGTSVYVFRNPDDTLGVTVFKNPRKAEDLTPVCEYNNQEPGLAPEEGEDA